MTDNVTILRHSLQSLVTEQKKIDEVVKKTVTEMKNKYQRWASDTPADEHSFMDIKRDFDEAFRVFHGGTLYLNDFYALIQRIQVVEKAMSGYQKDNDDVKSKLSTIERKIDTTTTTASAEIENLKAADTRLDKSLGSLKATTEKELLDHTMRFHYVDSVKKFIQDQPEKDARQDNELAKLKEGVSTLNQTLTGLDRKFETTLAEANATLSILGHNDNQLHLKTQDLDTRANEMQDKVDDIWSNLSAANSKIEANARENLTWYQSFNQLSAEVRDNSLEITNLDQRNQQLMEVAANLQQEIVRLQMLGYEETLQNVKRQYSAMEHLVKTLARNFADYISGRSAIGFTASPSGMSKVNVTQDQIIKFQSVAFNNGDHYDPSTGVFTAPQSGLYFTSVTVSTLNAGRINVLIKHRPRDMCNGCRNAVSVSRTSTKVEDISCTGTGVVHMEAGDHLYAVPVTVTGDAVLSFYSSFSCFLLS